MSEIVKKEYHGAVGRRKTAVARVRLFPGDKTTFTVNGKPLEEYFKTVDQRRTALDAFTKAKLPGKFAVTALLHGGGLYGQAEALRHGLSRALISFDIELRGKLKKAGYLKRDPRAKERRKFGLKKARKAPQWSKR